MSWLLFLALATGSIATPSADRTIVLRMYVPRQMSAEYAAETRDVTTKVLAGSGVVPVWIVCSSTGVSDTRCHDPIEPNEVIVRTLPDRTNYGADRCGETYLERGSSQMITVFLDCCDEIARKTGLRGGLVHAHMLVHEVGHVLLGPEHSFSGIMQSPLSLHDWYVAALGRLTFTPEQTAALRQAIAQRASPAAGVPSSPLFEDRR